MSSEQADIGVVGMAVMGQNLALNIESRGYTVAVFNRTVETMRHFVDSAGPERRLVPCESLEEMVASLKSPRTILLMVKAGGGVDAVIKELDSYLRDGDILVDGGNSYFQDTIRRTRDAEKRGVFYIGTGVSGGEEGALRGPSIMPGGHHEAYEKISSLLEAIAAKVDSVPCCTYIGSDGSGHYVKMIHNGIEYGDMQLISEAYSLLRDVLGLEYREMRDVFSEWNSGELSSYLIEITADILSKTDAETDQPMAEVILDKAAQKGTGKWTIQSALDLGISIPTIAEAVFGRFISAAKEERTRAALELRGPSRAFTGNSDRFIESIRKALYASKVCSYAQGFSLMRAAANEYGWNLHLGEIAMIWRGGCIIRANFLNKIKEAYDRRADLPNLLLDSYFSDIVHSTQEDWRRVVVEATQLGVPVSGFSSALHYYDAYRTERLAANLIQAQRDYFGAHTYERIDRDGSFHTDWLAL